MFVSVSFAEPKPKIQCKFRVLSFKKENKSSVFLFVSCFLSFLFFFYFFELRKVNKMKIKADKSLNLC